jgi:3-oxoacyl-[acyl-carrier protein] reductase
MGSLDGKVALVTGGGRGIGAGISRRLAAEGALVAVHYGDNAQAAKETVSAVEASGGIAFPVGAPLADADSAAKLFEQLDVALTAHTGSTSLDILVNNAGSSAQADLASTTVEIFDHLFAVNVRAPLLIAQAAVKRMRHGGRIIGMSSAVIDLAVPTSLVYSMTKAALVMMGRTLANELAPRGITVNTLAPGLVETDMVSHWVNYSDESRAQAASLSKSDRIAAPSDVAGAVAFLCSEDARWITGQIINVCT